MLKYETKRYLWQFGDGLYLIIHKYPMIKLIIKNLLNLTLSGERSMINQSN